MQPPRRRDPLATPPDGAALTYRRSTDAARPTPPATPYSQTAWDVPAQTTPVSALAGVALSVALATLALYALTLATPRSLSTPPLGVVLFAGTVASPILGLAAVVDCVARRARGLASALVALVLGLGEVAIGYGVVAAILAA